MRSQGGQQVLVGDADSGLGLLRGKPAGKARPLDTLSAQVAIVSVGELEPESIATPHLYVDFLVQRA